MTQPAPIPPAEPEDDEFGRYWQELIASNRHQIIVIDPAAEQPELFTVEAPVSYGQLTTLGKSENMARVAVRFLHGKVAHLYVPGFWSEDDASKSYYEALPTNEAAIELAARCDINADIRGRAVILTGDAIDPRDIQPELVACNADTVPEIERDHAYRLDHIAGGEWARIEQLMDGQLIPSMLTTAPSMDRIAWLLRIMMVGLDTEIVTHAAVLELGAKKPLFFQAMAALWNIQAAHFNGSIEDLTPDEDQSGPPKQRKPAGWSERHQQVVH